MQDLRLALRSLAAAPIVSAVAIISLALGIGANTAIFSLVDSLVLRTLPVVAPQQLAMISTPRAASLGSTAGWSYAVWDEIRRRPHLFVASLLYGLQPRDPVTMAAAAITLSVVAAIASWLPARRASRVDPAIVLREP